MKVASRGSVGGVRVLSPGAWEKLHAEVTTANIFQVFPTHFRWVQHNISTFRFLPPEHLFLLFVRFSNIFLVCSQGGVARFQEAEGAGVGRDGYWGWHGYGGSVFQWDPELRIGWVSTISRYIVWSIYNI